MVDIQQQTTTLSLGHVHPSGIHPAADDFQSVLSLQRNGSNVLYNSCNNLVYMLCYTCILSKTRSSSTPIRFANSTTFSVEILVRFQSNALSIAHIKKTPAKRFYALLRERTRAIDRYCPCNPPPKLSGGTSGPYRQLKNVRSPTVAATTLRYPPDGLGSDIKNANTCMRPFFGTPILKTGSLVTQLVEL